jgi:hypothetical protein
MAQTWEQKEREERKKKRGGNVPPLVSRPFYKERKREKGKRGRGEKERAMP